MKRLFVFAFLIALFCAGLVRADDVDSARAAARGAATTANVSQRTETTSTREQQRTNQKSESKPNQQVSARTAAPRSNTTAVTRTAATPVQTRELSSRSATTTSAVATRTTINNVSQTSVGRAGKPISTRISGQPLNLRGATISRAGTTTARSVGTPASGYKVCRETFFQCMDEFCANKDAQLKRCACSARIHEFDDDRKTLDSLEEKMLDFNERLLAVSMDKEDAVAMSTATEGEKAFQQDDKSESKDILDTIMKKLQSTNEETESNNNLSAINLSLDTNVFDTIDSQFGIETTTKEGEDLYNAALPTCLEMANEVCAEDEISTIQNAYVASIEQDCNTVKKTYDTLKQSAMEKVREGSALLDMSRLNNQQTRNSDNVLTCKKKMLDVLSDDAVCGTDLGKCLDWSGKYISPLTGSAILTSDLNQLANMISRPTGDEKWAKVGANSKFVSFLETKKKYIEPAMKNCESLSTTVWTSFLEDALAQIKLAQGQKLEDMRQSCTTLTTECMTNVSDSLVDFDSRALSIFGVNYDKNVNDVCADIKTACTTLMNGEGTDAYWGEAIGNIATAKTLDQIITTCTEVGKNCIIRNCMNLESKFGLCQSETAIMRANILKHDSSNPCWDEVSECVADAGTLVISKIMTTTGKFGTEDVGTGNFIEAFTGGGVYNRNSLTTTVTQSSNIWLWCEDGLANSITDNCRIAERIWGNCNENPTTGEGVILESGLQSESLLAWFAENTIQSCNGSTCPPGLILIDDTVGCVSPADLTSDMLYAPITAVPLLRFNVSGTDITASYGDDWDGNWTNRCTSNKWDDFGNCCADTTSVVDAGHLTASSPISDTCSNITTNSEFITSSYINNTPHGYAETDNNLVCVGGSVDWGSEDDTAGTGAFPHGDTATCDGKLMIVNSVTGLYVSPGITSTPESQVQVYYNIVNGRCVYTIGALSMEWDPTVSGETCDKVLVPPTVSGNNLFIDYL